MKTFSKLNNIPETNIFLVFLQKFDFPFWKDNHIFLLTQDVAKGKNWSIVTATADEKDSASD